MVKNFLLTRIGSRSQQIFRSIVLSLLLESFSDGLTYAICQIKIVNGVLNCIAC
jgi:hypothetical protein